MQNVAPSGCLVERPLFLLSTVYCLLFTVHRFLLFWKLRPIRRLLNISS